jgi:hypothetical protein
MLHRHVIVCVGADIIRWAERAGWHWEGFMVHTILGKHEDLILCNVIGVFNLQVVDKRVLISELGGSVTGKAYPVLSTFMSIRHMAFPLFSAVVQYFRLRAILTDAGVRTNISLKMLSEKLGYQCTLISVYPWLFATHLQSWRSNTKRGRLR